MKAPPTLLRCRWLFLIVAVLTSAALGADYTGTVLTPDNKPVKGATVYLVELVNQTPSSATRPALPTTRTDDAGVFHFPRARAGGAEFIAAADGFGLSSTELNGAAPIQMQLRPRTDLTITFHTPDNKPAANVPISIRRINLPMRISDGSFHNLWIPPYYRSPWSAITDANGACTFPGLPQGGVLKIDIGDPRYAQFGYNQTLDLSGSAQTRDGPIRLQLAASISGKIIYGSTGQPAAGIRVLARSESSEPEQDLTAADGSYAIKRLRPLQIDVTLDLSEDLQKSWTVQKSLNLTLAAGQNESDVNFTLIPGVRLAGTVLAADDSKPIPGVELGIYNSAHPRSSGTVQSVTTDANGAFSVRVPPGQQNIYLMSDTPADGFSRPGDDERDITIPENSAGSVQFRLPRAFLAPIKGKVVDPDGNPVAGASVFAYSEQSVLLNNIRNAITTNADGTFQTPPVPRNAHVDLRARFGDLATPRSITVTRNASGSVTLQLEKNAFAALVGRVVDQRGQPLKNARIELLYSIGRYRFGDEAGVTDDRGNYKIDSLWADMSYSIDVTCDFYGEAESNNSLRVSPGQSTTIPDLTLYKRDSTIAGVLLDRNNKPVAGQRVFVRGPRSGYSNLNTDANGKFQCAVVANDRLTIFYNFNSSRGLSRQSAKAGDQNIVLHTAPPIAAAAAAPAPGPPAAGSVAESAPVFDPAEAVTWNGWLWAVILLLAGSVVTIIVNAVAAIRSRKSPKIVR